MKEWWRKFMTGGDSATRARRVYWISGAVGVAILAAVMLGFAAFGPIGGPSKNTVKPIVVPDEQRKESDKLTTEGEAALASGDTTSAASLVARAIVLNPQNEKAKQLIKNIETARKKPVTKVVTSTPPPVTPPPPGSPDPFLGNMTNITLLLPPAFDGYDLGQPVAGDTDVSVSGTPASKSASADRIVWSVHQTASAEEASKFIARVSKSAYGKDSADLNIGGVSGYFGTDGTRFATIAYVRGKYVFEVLATSSSAAPVGQKNTAVRAAEAFPDVPPK